MDTVALLGRVLVSLGAVLAVMWVLARRMRAGGKARGNHLIEVLGRQQVSRGASVAVVRIGEQALIVGVTDNQISLLSDTDLDAAQSLLADNQPAARRAPRRKHGDPATRPVRVAKAAPRTAPRATPETADAEAERPGALAGSALSAATWKQTIESLRDLTARTD